jgi:hypothetical protein
MTTSQATPSAADTASEVGGVLIGFGILTMALFPFALPILLLTAAFAAPLVLLPLVAALPFAVVAGVVLAVRRLGRRRHAPTELAPGRIGRRRTRAAY